MTLLLTQRTDAEGRVTLPSDFASTTVIIDVVSENEVRIRKVAVATGVEPQFVEESARPLSDAGTRPVPRPCWTILRKQVIP